MTTATITPAHLKAIEALTEESVQFQARIGHRPSAMLTAENTTPALVTEIARLYLKATYRRFEKAELHYCEEILDDYKEMKEAYDKNPTDVLKFIHPGIIDNYVLEAQRNLRPRVRRSRK